MLVRRRLRAPNSEHITAISLGSAQPTLQGSPSFTSEGTAHLWGLGQLSQAFVEHEVQREGAVHTRGTCVSSPWRGSVCSALTDSSGVSAGEKEVTGQKGSAIST